MGITIPVPLRYALSLLAGVLAVLNVTVFHAGARWSAYIAVALLFLASLGIPPVVGEAFQRLLATVFPGHWLTTVRVVITAGMAALTLLLSSASGWSTLARSIAAGVLTILMALGFGKEVVSAVVPAGQRARPGPTK